MEQGGARARRICRRFLSMRAGRFSLLVVMPYVVQPTSETISSHSQRFDALIGIPTVSHRSTVAGRVRSTSRLSHAEMGRNGWHTTAGWPMSLVLRLDVGAKSALWCASPSVPHMIHRSLLSGPKPLNSARQVQMKVMVLLLH